MFTTDAVISVLQQIIDVLVVAYLIYRVLLIIRGTRAVPMLWGLIIVVGIFFVSDLCGLVTLHWLLNNFLNSLIVVVLVVFQEEIRRGLTKVGLQPFFRQNTKLDYGQLIDDLVYVAQRLAERKIGALIAIQRDMGLADFLEESTELNADVSRKLLYSIFVKESTLHDGAVVIADGRIKAAGCVLPLSFNPDLDPNLGTRHRASLGLSERSDAVIVVVSEETGGISVAKDGNMIRNLDGQTLKDLLTKSLQNRDDEEEKAGGEE